MKEKITQIVIIIVNIIGIFCLIYVAIPYLAHEISEPNPEAMITFNGWEAAGILLTAGFFPLLGANIFAFEEIFKEKIKLPFRLLFFLPSIICMILVICFWIEEFQASSFSMASFGLFLRRRAEAISIFR